MPVAALLARTGVTPNTLTVLALVVTLPVAPILAHGPTWFPLAAALIVLALILDGFDGLVARVTNQVTLVGDFLDATLDRYGEGVIFIGLVYWYITTTPPDIPAAVLTVLTLFGSLMVSYTRARSELRGLEMEAGLFPRFIRLVLLVLGLALAPAFPQSMLVVLVVLAIGTNVTALQRLVAASRQLASLDAATARTPEVSS
jgi:CDP-diacylglycerol--glycerol-3-phosphate 3-phosphatidyltransferase